MKLQLDKIGTIGMIMTALLSPCCFPLFGFALTALGFGSFELFGGWTMWIFQGMVLLSLVGFYFSYRQHRCTYPLLIAIPSVLFIFYAYHLDNSDNWIVGLYIGMFGLLAATLLNVYRVMLHKKGEACCASSKEETIILESTITCPNCAHQKIETMPTQACQYFYECEKCKQILKPNQGDCCVYCSYGSVKCPPVQLGTSCC